MPSLVLLLDRADEGGMLLLVGYEDVKLVLVVAWFEVLVLLMLLVDEETKEEEAVTSMVVRGVGWPWNSMTPEKVSQSHGSLLIQQYTSCEVLGHFWILLPPA
jgi:hypothetical protein